MVEPTDRSIPPEIMTNVSATPRMRNSLAYCVVEFHVCCEKKPCPVMVNTMTNAARTPARDNWRARLTVRVPLEPERADGTVTRWAGGAVGVLMAFPPVRSAADGHRPGAR